MPFPLLKCFKNARELELHALWTAFRTISRPKFTRLRDFPHKISKIFRGVTPVPPQKRSIPGAWTQTPISAWLASVPIVAVLRNGHCRTR